MEEISIYVLPSQEGTPPRALLMGFEGGKQTIATWSRDLGVWVLPTVDGGQYPLPEEMSNSLTEHAKSLGVEW